MLFLFLQLSFIVRIVPSPDWFVGEDSLNLCEGDHWKENISLDLYPYDAGTDSGFTFSSPNFETIPQDKITQVMAKIRQYQLTSWLFIILWETIFVKAKQNTLWEFSMLVSNMDKPVNSWVCSFFLPNHGFKQPRIYSKTMDVMNCKTSVFHSTDNLIIPKSSCKLLLLSQTKESSSNSQGPSNQDQEQPDLQLTFSSNPVQSDSE